MERPNKGQNTLSQTTETGITLVEWLQRYVSDKNTGSELLCGILLFVFHHRPITQQKPIPVPTNILQFYDNQNNEE